MYVKIFLSVLKTKGICEFLKGLQEKYMLIYCLQRGLFHIFFKRDLFIVYFSKKVKGFLKKDL